MEQWLQSRYAMVEWCPLCSVSQTFSDAPFARRPQRLARLPCEANPLHGVSLSKPWETHLLAAARMSIKASGRTSLHNCFFWAFARHFVIYLTAPQWGSSQSGTGSTLQLLVFSFCSTFFVSLASSGETEAPSWLMICMMILLCSGWAMKPPSVKLDGYLWWLSWGILTESWRMLVYVEGPSSLCCCIVVSKFVFWRKGSAWWRHDIQTSVKAVKDLVGHIVWDICFTFSQINSLIQSEKLSMVFTEISRYVYTLRGKHISFSHVFPSSFQILLLHHKDRSDNRKIGWKSPFKMLTFEVWHNFLSINRSSYKSVFL